MVQASLNIKPQTCELLGFESLVLQGFLGTIAILSLVLKRKYEIPRRPWKIWLFDVSKQIIGAFIIHFLNVLGSILLSSEPDEGLDENPCTWYFLNVLFDTTVGVPILWCMLWYVYRFATKLNITGIQSGEYGDPPKAGPYLKQLSLYLLALVLSKIVLSLVLYFVPFLDDWAAYLISWSTFDERVEIVFVMLVFPTVMNSLQYYVVDSIIQSPEFGVTHEPIHHHHHTPDRNYSTFTKQTEEP